MNPNLSENILILDGGMGTELMKKKIDMSLPLWSAEVNDKNSKEVYKIHLEYRRANSDILTANTFRTTPYYYQKTGLDKKEAVIAAKNSFDFAIKEVYRAKNINQLVAGSIAPIEDCYSPHLFPGYIYSNNLIKTMIEWFLDTDIDILLFETMGNIKEIINILNNLKNWNRYLWLSLILKDSKTLLDGTPLNETIAFIRDSNVDVLLLNCNTIDLTIKAIDTIKINWNKSWGVYPNLGISNPEKDGSIIKKVSDKKWKENIRTIFKKSPNVLGACCGSSPRHIYMIYNEIKSYNNHI